MASEATVSFKAYLRRNNSQENPEVRRFGVDGNVVSSFTYMKEKLQVVFPSLKGKLFTVSWKDADGDDVLISSDEELIIALTDGKSDVYKLYVDVKGDLKDIPEAMHVEESAVGDDVHVGVVCDGCSGSVEGFRYKCAMCPNYDLCPSCEAKGIHAEHIMLRLPAPHMWHPRFKHHLVHRLVKSVRKCEGKKEEDGHRRGRGGKHGHERHCSPEETWRGKHAHDRRCSPEEPQEPAGPSGRQRGGCPMRGHGGRPSFVDFLSSYLGENVSKDSMESREYLKTIGRTVAQFLDPLGIAVNVELRTDEDAEGAKPKEADQAGRKASPDAQQKVRFAGDAADSAPPPEVVVCESVEMMDESSQSSQPRAEGRDPELEHWTLVNNAGGSAPAEEPEAQVPSAPAVPASSEASVQTHATAVAENAAAVAAAAAAEARRLAAAAMQHAGAAGGFTVRPGVLYPALAPQPPPAATQDDSARAPRPP
ncbi:sequestosome-1 isoform X2 [Bacillus rossius redtenbacheri]|uniref:sequestosome-1 isoform X2 n=1 Tax=Bacillus rossius redtenbacheri TaxID=93214 RepID=UPI002FDEA7A2